MQGLLRRYAGLGIARERRARRRAQLQVSPPARDFRRRRGRAERDRRSVVERPPRSRMRARHRWNCGPDMHARGVNGWPNVRHDMYGVLDRLHRFLPAGFYYKTFMAPDWHRYEPRDPAHGGTRAAARDGGYRCATRRGTRIAMSWSSAVGRPDWRRRAPLRRQVCALSWLTKRAKFGGALRWRGGTIDDRRRRVMDRFRQLRR